MEPATINWYRSPIEKETLRQLTRKSDLKGWLQAGSFLMIYLALTAFALYLSRIRLWVPMVIVCYIQSVLVSFYMGLASAVHELGYGTPFKSKPVNEFFLYLFSLLTWSNPVHLRASHIQNHHPFTLYRGRYKEVIQVLVKEKLNWVNVLSWFTFDFKWCAVSMRANVLHALGNANASRAVGGSVKEMIVMCGANGRI
jgi:fatty acid desaturase